MPITNDNLGGIANNGTTDTLKRLFVPFGIGADREKSPWWDLGGQLTSGGQAQEDERKRRELLYQQSALAGGFADRNEQTYGQLGQQGQGALAGLQRIAQGENSVSAEQLRQALGQNVAAQRSMAASASPQNAAMAARTAAIMSGRAGSGLAGQQAVAGLQERDQAQQRYGQLLQGLRGQDLNAALGSRQTATTGYGASNAGTPEKTEGQKVGPVIQSMLSAFSDRRLKKDIADGDADAARAIKGLRSYTFAYKDEQHGKGRQFGTMTDDLKGAGLGHAVIKTPAGEMVHGAKLATSAIGLIGALGRRVAKIEGDRK